MKDMTIDEIIGNLRENGGVFQRAAVEAAVERQEEVAPSLLELLEETLATPLEQVDEDDIGHLYAMYLLAQFRDVRAYPLVVRFGLLSQKELDVLLGDFLTESYGDVLASVCGGDLAGIQSIIENESASEWARASALSGILTLVTEEVLSRDHAVEYLGELFSKLDRKPSFVWDDLVATAADLHPDELFEKIEEAYRDDLVDPGCVSLEEVKRDRARGRAACLARLRDKPLRHFINDTVAEMEWWACFQPDGDDDEAEDDLWDIDDFDLGEPGLSEWSVETVRRAGPKVGRNDPCPCGSGKKYKKCCGG